MIDSLKSCERTRNKAVHEDFIDALKHCFHSPKSERLPYNSFYELYSHTALINQMQAPGHQVIWGRRGTGKTHLLKAFCQSINETDDGKFIALYISCEEIETETPRTDVFSNDMERVKQFAWESMKRFIKLFTDRAIDHYEKILNEQVRCGKITKTAKKEIMDKADTIFLELMSIHDFVHKTETTIGEQAEEYEEEVNGDVVLKETYMKISISEILKCLLSFDFACIMEGFKGLFSKGSSSIKNGTVRRSRRKTIITESHVDFVKLREKIDLLVSSLGVMRIFICIDELSRIDEKNAISFQPVFLDYLRKIFFSTPTITIKIASIRELTHLYSKVRMKNAYGIRNGHDITELVNFDDMFSISNSQKKLEMFSDMLSKRIKYYNKNKENNDFPAEYVIDTLFKESRHLIALIDLSHGLPRNFLNNLRNCLLRVDYNLQKNFIHWYLSVDIAVDAYSNEKRALIEFNAGTLYSLIQDYVLSSRQYFFIIRNDHVKNFKEDINDLYGKEIIHRLPSKMTPINIRNEYKPFYIDLGFYFFIIDDKKYNNYKEQNKEFILSLPEDIATNEKKYVIDPNQIASDFIECPSCNKRLSKKHAVYKSVKLCYFCAFKFSTIQKRNGC